MQDPDIPHRQVLVTGANGFVGRHVARLYARQGYSVTGLGHGDWSRDEWSTWGLTSWHPGDVSLQSLEATGIQPEVILHCAGTGSVGFAISNPLDALERTVVSTAHVLEYARLHAPNAAVVYPSSASVYGTVEQLPIREDSESIPISQYGTHKVMVEQMLASFSRQFGIKTAIVRFFSLYGAGLRKQLLWDGCRKLNGGDAVFMGTGREVRDWLHIEDAASLMHAAAQHASVACPLVNGGSGEGATVRDVLQHLSDSLGHDLNVSFSGALREGDPSCYIADISRAAAWGWQPTYGWQAGVADYAAWWKREAQ